MLSHGKQYFRPAPPRKGAIARYAIGGAWLFLLASLVQITWGVAASAGGATDPTTLYQVNSAGATYRSLAMTYAGTAGLIWGLLQGAIVLAAATLTVVSRGGLRRAGHAALIAWATVWLVDVLRLALIAPHVLTVSQTLVMATFLGCTIYRAVAPRPAVLSPRDVQSSDAVREIPTSRASRMTAWLDRAKAGAKQAGPTVVSSLGRAGAWTTPRVKIAIRGARENARRLMHGPSSTVTDA